MMPDKGTMSIPVSTPDTNPWMKDVAVMYGVQIPYTYKQGNNIEYTTTSTSTDEEGK